MKNTVFVATIVVLCCLGSGPVLADVVPPPPNDCMEGTRGGTGHGGAYCSPKACSADSECSGGEVCRDVPLCAAEIVGGGRRPPGTPAPKYHTILNTCAKADGSECSRPDGAQPHGYGDVTKGTCKAFKMCASATGSTSNGGGKKKSCSGSSAPMGVLWAVAGFLALLWVRRS